MIVTLLTTVRNNPAGLERVIDRFRTIACPLDRMIVVDDGSEPPIHQTDSENIKVIRPGKVGRARALNLGISDAEPGMIAINDSDDLPRSDRLAWARAHGERGTEMLLTPPNERRLLCGPVVPSHRLFRGNPFPHSGISFSKGLWQRIGGYDETLSICIDYDFILRGATETTLHFDPRPAIERDAAGGGAVYRRVDSSAYFEQLAKLRRRHREILKPPFWTWLWDLRLNGRHQWHRYWR